MGVAVPIRREVGGIGRSREIYGNQQVFVFAKQKPSFEENGPEETQPEHLVPLKPSLKFLQTIDFPQHISLQRILNLNNR